MAKSIYETNYLDNLENIKKEIIKFNFRYKKGHENEMPTYAELRLHDYSVLARNITSHGGSIILADQFGLKLSDRRRNISKNRGWKV
jgi:hypothetical protein